MKIKSKVIIGSLVFSALMSTNLSAKLTDGEKTERYQNKAFKKIEKKLNRIHKKQESYYKKSDKYAQKADKLEEKILLYESIENCIDTSSSINKIKKCLTMKSPNDFINTQGANEENIEVSQENTPNLLYLLGSSYSDIKNKNYNFDMITVDLEDSSVSDILNLKSDGKTVICYMSAGSYENWRSDKDMFPKESLGKNLDGWAGEKWLDIRNDTVLEIMKDRINLASEKGCDVVDFDNIDGYSNDTGFSLTQDDQFEYDKNLSEYAHSLGLKTVLKNNLELIDTLSPYYDYAVNESCHKYNECDMYDNWLNDGKLVWNIEYSKPKNISHNYDNFITYLMDRELSGKTYKKL